jgi:predicted transcriptional regulator
MLIDMQRTNNRSTYNESKYKIFLLLEPGEKYYSPREIAMACNLSLACTKSELTRLNNWGYIWRAVNTGKGRHHFVYQNLKPKGIRCLTEWKLKKDISQMTGIEVSLNRKIKIPDELMSLYNKLKDVK